MSEGHGPARAIGSHVGQRPAEGKGHTCCVSSKDDNPPSRAGLVQGLPRGARKQKHKPPNQAHSFFDAPVGALLAQRRKTSPKRNERKDCFFFFLLPGGARPKIALYGRCEGPAAGREEAADRRAGGPTSPRRGARWTRALPSRAQRVRRKAVALLRRAARLSRPVTATQPFLRRLWPCAAYAATTPKAELLRAQQTRRAAGSTDKRCHHRERFMMSSPKTFCRERFRGN